MKIKTKILWILLCTSLLVALVGAMAINRQHAAAMVGVTKEAEDVARVVSFLFSSDSNKFSAAAAQEIVAKLHQAESRDVMVVDSRQIILADAVPSNVGKEYTDDPTDEVGATLKDRRVRTFVEVSKDYPAGIKQIAVPIVSESGQVIGAVILEYTPLYNELMQLTGRTIRQVVFAVCGSVAIALLIAFYVGRSIARPLQELRDAATGFASGRTDLPMPPARRDEIGDLAMAFTDMMQKRQRAEDELRSLHDELEVRVIDRTVELAETNEALQAENIARKRGEESLKKSELLYRSLFQNMLDGYAHCRMVYEQDQLPDFIYLDVNSAFETLTGLKNVVGKKVSEVIPGFQAANPELLEIYSRVASTGKSETCETYLESLGIWFSVAAYSPAKEHFVAVFENITERKLAEQTVRESNEKFHQLANNITDAFWIRSPDMSEVQYVSPAFERIWGRPVESLHANPQQWEEAIQPEDRERVLGVFASLMGDARSLEVEYRIVRPDGEIRWVQCRGFQVRDAADKLIRLTGIVTDITERKRAETELKKTHGELVKASHQAGMAEVATGVLHNVGNVLNSVNVASTCVAASLRKSMVANLGKVAAMMREHQTDLGTFMSNDPKGKQLPGYLAQLAEQLASDQAGALKELAQLQKNIEHIKDIVTVQQSCAKGTSKSETVQITDLVEDTLRMDSGGQISRDIQVIREFEHLPTVTVEKHKVMQILMNLVRNAKQACQGANCGEKRLTLRATNRDDYVRIAVSDNGVGISPENLARIFAHGFTTKKEGHGFGLHSAAAAAKEMGGSLSVHSGGLGHGATFTLELPR